MPPQSCSLCSFETEDLLDLNVHNANIHFLNFACKFCPEQSAFKDQIVNHILLEHLGVDRNDLIEKGYLGTKAELNDTKLDGLEEAAPELDLKLVKTEVEEYHEDPIDLPLAINDVSSISQPEFSIGPNKNETKHFCKPNIGNFNGSEPSKKKKTQSSSKYSELNNFEADLYLSDKLDFCTKSKRRKRKRNVVNYSEMENVFALSDEDETPGVNEVLNEEDPQDIDYSYYFDIKDEPAEKDETWFEPQKPLKSNFKSEKREKFEPRKGGTINCPLCLDYELVGTKYFYKHVKAEHPAIFGIDMGIALATNLECHDYINRRKEFQTSDNMWCPICYAEMKFAFLKGHLATAHQLDNGPQFWSVIQQSIKFWTSRYPNKFRKMKDVTLKEIKVFAMCSPFCGVCKKTFISWKEVVRHIGSKSCNDQYLRIKFVHACDYCTSTFVGLSKLMSHVSSKHKEHYESFRSKAKEMKEQKWKNLLKGFPKRCDDELSLLPQCHLCSKFFNEWKTVDRHLYMGHKR